MEFELTALVVIGTYSTGSSITNYNTITTTMIPNDFRGLVDISINSYYKKVKINMSQSQTFNLIHKWYQYIISSNKELLRCKKIHCICTLEPSIKSIIRRPALAYAYESATEKTEGIIKDGQSRDTRNIRHTINRTKTNKTNKT